MGQINAGVKPEDLGLPNLGIPAAIPLLGKTPERRPSFTTGSGHIGALEGMHLAARGHRVGMVVDATTGGAQA